MKYESLGKWAGFVLLLCLTVGERAAGEQQAPDPAANMEEITEQSEEKETKEEESENWLDGADDWMENTQNQDNWWEDYWLYDDPEQSEEQSDGWESESVPGGEESEKMQGNGENEEASDGREDGSVSPDGENSEKEMPEEKTTDMQKYLPVIFRPGVSSLECFPETVGAEKVVQNGFPMLRLPSVNVKSEGQVGAYYRKIAVFEEKWYDLKMTLMNSEGIEILSKDGLQAAVPEIGFCMEQMGWGLRGQQGTVTLKMEFVESKTEKPAAINTRFCWRNVRTEVRPEITLEDGTFGAHYFIEEENGLGDMVFLLDGCSTWYMTWGNGGNAPFEVVCQEDLFEEETEPHIEENEKEGKKIIRKDAAVRILVSKRDIRTKQWIKDAVFEVYEWDGYKYSIYRGSLIYYEKNRHYIMDNLVRNEVNQGKYKIMEANSSADGISGWQQEILVPEIPVVTDLYYYVEG